MAYDPTTAERLRSAVLRTRPEGREQIAERKMFGGIALLLDGSMCCGVIGHDLVVRTGATGAAEALARPHARPMDFTGTPLRGFVYVAPDGFRSEAELDEWVARGLAGAREAAREKAAKPRKSSPRSSPARPTARRATATRER
jgi:TfoX/Sxy family transcriptional regulator of competence genes